MDPIALPHEVFHRRPLPSPPPDPNESPDELSALRGNVIIPRARRSAAIASQRRTATEMGKFVGRPDDDDDSDEDGEVDGNFETAAGGLADGESDEEAELEF